MIANAHNRRKALPSQVKVSITLIKDISNTRNHIAKLDPMSISIKNSMELSTMKSSYAVPEEKSNNINRKNDHRGNSTYTGK